MNRIINFHKVDDITWFDSLISQLKRKYNFVSADALYHHYKTNETLKKSCHITIDDGDKSFYDVIFPVLKKHKIPASLYVSPKICKEKNNFWFQEIEGYDAGELKKIFSEIHRIPVNQIKSFSVQGILKTLKISEIQEIITTYQKRTRISNKPFQNISISNLLEIQASGFVTLGAHTLNHPILKNEEPETSKTEVCNSISDLSDILNGQVKYFAYPNGIPGLDFTDREMAYLNDSAINLAFTTVSKNFSLKENAMSIHRIGISDWERIAFTKIKLGLGSAWEPLKKVKWNGEYSERKKINLLYSKLNF